MKHILRSFSFVLFALSFSSASAQTPAFPGAEGHGRYVTGGRAADGTTKVYHVTNLQNNGTGSLRWALSQAGPRTIVFDVGGVIALESDLSIPANTTIAGQTAPAPGITLRYYTIHGVGNNVIIRFIRSRRGQERDINDGADAIWERNKTGIIIDHCSFSWSIDEVASFYDNNNFTMQWCTLGESLNNAGHGKGAHGYGGIWGGKLASFHHNMICHVGNRSPRFNGARYNWTGYTGNKRYSEFNWQNAVQSENVDFRNCVIYNCGNGCYGGPGGGQINMVNNYYKTGPAAGTSSITTASVANSTSSADNQTYWNMFSRYYISGNMLNNAEAGWNKVSYDNGTKTKDGIRYTPDPKHYYGDGVTYVNIDGTDCVSMVLDQPTDYGQVTTHDASTAFEQVLSYAGASFIRDNVDERYMDEARNGTATYKGSVTKKAGRIDLVSDVDGYTEANFGTGQRAADFDADNDGMADEWEQKNGGDLDPNAFTVDPQQKYSNIEVYLNSLVEDIVQQGNSGGDSNYEEYFPACTKIEIDNGSGGGGDQPQVDGLQGNITWELSSNTNAAYSTGYDQYVGDGSFTLGNNLVNNGYGTYGGVRFCKLQAQSIETSASDNNAISMAFMTKGGEQFKATSVSFNACKIGTNYGNFDVKWMDGGGTVNITTGAAPNRNNEDNGYYTAFSRDISSQTTATDGTCQLVINAYNFGSADGNGNLTKKEFGLANVVVNGVITNAAGIETPVTVGLPVSTEYYDLNGRQLSEPRQGITLRVDRLTNGQTVTTKVVY